MINISRLYCGLKGDSDNLRYSSKNSYGPVVVYNCTKRCNLNCSHCYSSSSRFQPFSQLSTKQAKHFLSQLAAVNCPVVLFSGGEPLLREDLFELLAEAKELGLRSVLSTNGTLIDSATAEKLARLGTDYIGVSIDGSERFHDSFRGVKGSFKMAIAGIENCRQAGIKTGLRFTMTGANIEQIPAVFELAASLDVRRLCFYHLIRTGRAEELTGYLPTSRQVRSGIDTIIEKTGQFVRSDTIDEVLTVGNHCDGPYLLIKLAEKANTAYYKTARRLLLAGGGNRIGSGICCVSWDGQVYPDQFWRNYSLGSVGKNSFRDIWLNDSEPVLKRLRNRLRPARSRCSNCVWFDLCRGNFRFTGSDPQDDCWFNEPACYLTDAETAGEALTVKEISDGFS